MVNERQKNGNSISCDNCLDFRQRVGMLGFALADFHRRKFCTKISTGFVEIFDGFRDGNLTSETVERPFQ